ncbi:MAG: gliding motility-associated C-terminal domain-containing protein [Bacteroidetes bacterium]|nr:gliding motility-associated C-terminal domain-containing protein [Bacteroidota bacterium]
MKLKSILFSAICFFALYSAVAQTVNLRVNITGVERTNYNDCSACGNPDPTWKITVTDNAPGSVVNGPYCFHYNEDPNTFESLGTFNVWNVTNSAATTFTMGLNDAFEKNCSSGNDCDYESYNFFRCFPSVYGDANRCNNTNLAVINFMDSSPCQLHSGVSPWCGNYRFYYSFTWSFNYAPTITTQPTAFQGCIGTPTTLQVAVNNDPHGWTLGQNYQWQVSSNTSCPGSNWTNVVGANSSSFTPPQTGGTRLYRVLVTSNCSANFNTNTTTSNCVAVTYNPVGGSGDPVPPIVSGICGSTVLPGSTHTLNILTPPTVGALVGATGYNWTATGGSPTTGSTSTFTWTAPVSPGSYSINLTYLTACPPNVSANTCVVIVGSPTCDFAYIAPTGKDSVFAGGPDVPYKSIAYALTQLGGRTKIRLAVGTYNETVPLNIQNNLVFDGGYVINSGIWTKTNSDSTYIICSGSEVINGDVAHRIGFKSNGSDNWELQDLVIKTTDINQRTTNGEGYSNYGVLAYNNSTNFKIVRTKVYAGAASTGTSGTTPSGAGGAGGHGNGGAGGAGSTNRCGCSGNSPGTAGGAGNNGAGGGGGGGTGCGGGCNTVGCNASSGTGSGGSTGTAGGNAALSYVAGARPASPSFSAPYYIPSGQAANGSNGFGGGGGGGGGGGDIGTCCTCGCGGGSPDGGRGGNGGDGGIGGSGGFGGGGSFAIYASGASTTGTIITSAILPGSAGLGGNGAAGQPGSAAQGGSPGTDHGGCDGGRGGDGGNGGAGGSGGRGQDGANGLSQDIVTVNGAFISGSSTSVPNNYIVGVNYNNAKACIYSEITLTKNTGVWSFPGALSLENDTRDLPAGSPLSSYSASSSPVVVYTTTPDAEIDLTVNGLQYAAYLKIAADNRQKPVITPSSHTICLDGSVSLSATHWGTEQEYDWRVYQGANVNSPLYTSTVASPTVDFTGYTPGLYIVRYKVRESCCGWSIPIYDTIRILPLPVQFTVQGGGNYCPGGSGVPITLSGSEPGVKYVVYYNGAPVDSAIGTGASPFVFANETQVGIYTVVGYRFTGCGQNMLGFVNVGLSPTPTLFTVQGGGNACPGSSSGPAIYLSGSQLGVSYQLYLNNTTPVGNPVQGTGNQIPFGNAGQPGVYTVIGTFIASPYCSSKMTDSAVITLVVLPNAYTVTGGGSYCTGDSGRVIGLSNSDVGVTYSLYTGGVLVAGPIAGTGAPLTFGTFTLAGSYSAIATNIAGCDTAMNNSVIINPLPVPVISSVTSSDVSCVGGTNDTILLYAASANGSVFYSIDSGTSYTNTTGLFTSLPVGSYYIAVRDDSSCTARFAANPVILSQPASPLSVSAVSSDITCQGNGDGAINLLVGGGWGAYTYSWSSGQSVSSVSALAAGPYVATVTDAKGCQVVVHDTIHEPTPISVGSVVTTNVTCAGARNGSVHLNGVTGGTAPYTFLWSNFSITQNLDSLIGGTYYVIITDAKGCQLRDSGIVREGLPIAVSDTFVPISCNGANDASIHIIASGGSGSYSYTWSPSGSNSPDNTNLGPNTYSVTVSDANGCSAATAVTIVNPPALTLSHVFTNPTCNSAGNGSISMIPTGGTPGYTYQWAGGTFSGPIANNVSAGTYYITVTDAHGCTARDSVTITDPQPMYISGTPKNVTCNGDQDGYVIATGYGGTLPYSYQWYYDSLTGNPGPITKDIFQLSGGDYYLVITDANNCTVSYHAVIKEADTLRLSLVKTDATCQNANSGSVAAIVTGGVKPYEFLWSNFVTDSLQVGIPGGSYGVQVTDSNGCHVTKTILVDGQASPMTVNTAINNPTCNDGTNGFISLDVLGGTQPYTYSWSTSPPQTGNVASNLIGGTYYATVTDSKGCQVLDTATLVTPAAISASTAIGGATCVSAADGYVVISVTGGNAPYSYQLGNFVQSSDTFRNLTVGQYTLIIRDVNGCEGSTALTVAAPGYFTVDLTADPYYILAGEQVQLTATAATDTAPSQIRYIWNPLDSLNFQGCTDSSNCNDPIATPHVTRTYVVTAVNARGCIVTDTVLVTVSDHPSAFIPSAFTPNGDGRNDNFEFDILGAKSANVNIWNRWGERVFSNPTQLNGIGVAGNTTWDGTFRGKKAQFDSYIYQLDVLYSDGHRETISGTVTVMQ